MNSSTISTFYPPSISNVSTLSSYNFTDEDIIYSCVREVDTWYKTVIYSIYSIIFVIALVGNLFVCYAVLASPRMRTVTNYFILNLSIGDVLITILCVPFTSISVMNQNWPFGSFLCPVISYVQAISVFISAYTLVAISINKYMVIMWPLRPRISKKAATWVIIAIWIFAGVTVWPTAAFAELAQPSEFFVYCDQYICQENYNDVGEEYALLYSSVLMVLQYIIPFTVLLISYTSIAVIIWCHRIPGEEEVSRDRRMARSKRKMVKMMVTVVCVFTLCWLPYNILIIFSESFRSDLLEMLYFPFHILAMSHACYNPIIYCYMNSRFKESLNQILRRIPGCKGYYLRTGNGPPSVGIDPTDSALINRNNTYTTYISLKKNGLKSAQSCGREPARSASVRTNSSIVFSRKSRCSVNNILDEQI